MTDIPADNSEYVEKLLRNTSINLVLKRELQKKKNVEFVKSLSFAIDSLEQLVSSTCKDLMLHASNYGHFFTEILEFNNTDMFDEKFSYLFLFKGSIDKGVGVFKDEDIVPLSIRLNLLLPSITFYTRYHSYRKTHVLYANWSEQISKLINT